MSQFQNLGDEIDEAAANAKDSKKDEKEKEKEKLGSLHFSLGKIFQFLPCVTFDEPGIKFPEKLLTRATILALNCLLLIKIESF